MTTIGNDKIITIGICARNEEANIKSCLDSVLSNCKQFSKDVKIYIYICLNGCTDFTEKIVDDFIFNYTDDFPIEKLASRDGLINAQRIIVARSTRLAPGILFFVAADVILGDFCLVNLYNALISDKDLVVCCANSLIKECGRNYFMARLSCVFESEPQVMTERRYFIGRAFGVREWVVPLPEDMALQMEAVKNKIGINLFQFLNINSGILLDDLFASYRAVHEHGFKAILCCNDSIVYHPVIRSLKNYYLMSRRMFIEKEKLSLLFPEFSYLDQFFKRHKVREEFKKLTFKKKLYWDFYRFVGDCIKHMYVVERFLANKFGVVLIKNQWGFSKR